MFYIKLHVQQFGGSSYEQIAPGKNVKRITSSFLFLWIGKSTTDWQKSNNFGDMGNIIKNFGGCNKCRGNESLLDRKQKIRVGDISKDKIKGNEIAREEVFLSVEP